MTLAPHLFPTTPERLIVGSVSQIAHDAQFVTASANHKMDGISTYPFVIFDGMDPASPSMPLPGPDTFVGHDVWIGTGAMIMPGSHLGNGAIVGAGAVTAGVVPDFSIVAENPARIIRYRFEHAEVERLNTVAW